ncbi:MAG: YqgE/AlgH family protein [Paracoccaceae bacterium]
MTTAADTPDPSEGSSAFQDLTGTLLIAMPGLGDPRFDKSVVYLCAHADDGAMGLIINKPTSDITVRKLLEQLDIPLEADVRGQRVHFGGPVEQGRGFVLHSPDYTPGTATMTIDDSFCMTATVDILKGIAAGQGPSQRLVALGYAGWSPGQLETEIGNNSWLTCPATPDLVFGTPDQDKWQAAMTALGISPLLLSEEAGHA